MNFLFLLASLHEQLCLLVFRRLWVKEGVFRSGNYVERLLLKSEMLTALTANKRWLKIAKICQSWLHLTKIEPQATLF